MRISDWSSDVCSSDLCCTDLETGAYQVCVRALHARAPGIAPVTAYNCNEGFTRRPRYAFADVVFSALGADAMTADEHQVSGESWSAFAPLREKTFRNIWTASLLSTFGQLIDRKSTRLNSSH